MSPNDIQSPIRVCFISPKAYPLFNPNVEAVFGGAEVDLYYLATELAKDDSFTVSFITADYGATLAIANKTNIYAYDAYFIDCALRHAAPPRGCR